MTEKTEQKAQKVPSVGRIVHYILEEGPNKGECRPAIVVRVWAAPEDVTPQTAVQLQVFTDDTNDGLPGVVWKTSRCQGGNPGQWHWPEYVSAR